ncbi:hypothetical protein EYF80_056194 [Liparis tanakae]|uniref:Uncharacterized protein n=1 Tax=Liparis tanakae TaxID=230148 RepID=A0A4Z2EXF2_9TELE|nr:hypothetical protein EYF80_056194 [Liparis tanakae]
MCGLVFSNNGKSCFPSRQSNSLHLPLITSLVPHSLHLVLTPFSPAAHPLVSPSLPSPGPHALLTCL